MGKLFSALVTLSLIWGTSFLFMKLLLTELAPAEIVFGRSLFGMLTLLLVLLFQKKSFPFKKLPWGKLFLVALTNNALPWLFITTSETKISSSMASIINATTPIWTLVIGFLFFSSHLRKNQWIGIIIGFAGIFVLSDIKSGDLFSGNALGVILMTGATISYGIGAQMSKKYLSNLSVQEISFYTLLLSTMISFGTLLFLVPPSAKTIFHLEFILPFIGLGAFGSGLAYLLYYFLVKEGSAEFASLVTYIVPVSAIIWGAVLLNEPIHLSMLLGLMIIFIGVYISSRKPKLMAEETAAA
ncbi:DMT family transporter [Bacillota bacterium Lsc_1132]